MNYLWVDQYGDRIYAATVKQLRERAGGGHVEKMYIDKLDGTTRHVGYVVGANERSGNPGRWFTKYAPVEERV